MHAQHSSSFSTLPIEVHERIAYRLSIADLLGPPCPLISLLSTCKRINHVLSIHNNVHLYSNIFRAKFDYRAPTRRMCQEVSYSSALAHQLVSYCRALTNIRRGDIYAPSLLDDLYSMFTLVLEDDGRNAEQLEWAGLAAFVKRYILDRLWEGREECNGWPLEIGENTLALWLYFFSLNRHKLTHQPPEERDRLLFLLRPFAIYNFRYPPFLVPDNHFRLPLAGAPAEYNDHSAVTPHGFYPQYRDPRSVRHTLSHYGFHVAIAEPPVGLIAKLLYVALYECKPILVPDLVPRDRDEAMVLGVTGPTIADYDEFASSWTVDLPEAEAEVMRDDDGDDEELEGKSERQDNDWERWRACFDPWDATRARGNVYTLGSLSGMWGGQYLVPDIGNYHIAMTSDAFLPQLENPEVTASATPLFFRLHEHHCISPAVPLPPYLDHQPEAQAQVVDRLDEGVMNAYLPRGFPDAFVRMETGREGRRVVRWRRRGTTVEYAYETFEEGRESGHDEATCEICEARREAEREEREARLAEVDVDVDVEGEDEDEDAEMQDGDESVERVRWAVQGTLPEGMDVERLIAEVAREDTDGDDTGMHEHSDATRDTSRWEAASDPGTASDGDTEIFQTCSGVLDIIVTGETLARHAAAWGDFRIYGRVRSWDGLVVLVRAPIWDGPGLAPHDTFIFRGYLVGGRNLVGAWRHVTDSVHSIPLEGPFVVSRIVEGQERDGEGQDEDNPSSVVVEVNLGAEGTQQNQTHVEE